MWHSCRYHDIDVAFMSFAEANRRMFASWPDGLRETLIGRHLSGLIALAAS